MQPKVQHRKKKQAAKPEYKNLNAFKAQQKHYKLYQNQETDFSALFNPTKQDFVEVEGYQICQLPFPQGAYYVKNFVPCHQVFQIGYFGLNHYWRRPYRTNLDSRQQLYAKQQQKIQQKQSYNKNQIKQQQNMEQKQNVHQQQQNTGLQKQKLGKDCKYYFNQKIRWANVGYQYDWTLRKYPQVKTPIHRSIQQLSDRANKLYNAIEHIKKQYRPESAIINYYGTKDYMTGHLDDAEIDQQSPIYSFSFGLSCVFLMGGRTKEDEPTAIRLNSGDLLIMAGQSRKCYHGVPRIIEKSFQLTNIQQQKSQAFIKEIEQKQEVLHELHNGYQSIKNYFSSHRININIRQVYPQQI